MPGSFSWCGWTKVNRFGFIGPEVERRIAEYRAANGPVLFGGKLKSDTDFRLAVPDNLGASLIEEPRP